MSLKPAVTNFSIHPVIKERWSPRAFDGSPVENEKLQRIFEAARWAPSSSNEQPWRFIVGLKGDVVYDKIYSTLVEFNRLWAKTAPVLIVALAKKSSTKNPGKENKAAIYDLGQAIAYLTFQATADGLFVHQMGGFDTALTAKLLGVPDDYAVVTASAVGYIGNPEVLHPNLKELELAERKRQPLESLVFQEKFGEPASFFMDTEQ